MKNKHKTTSAAKKLTILGVVILTVFISLNLAWFIGKGLPYYGYTSKLAANEGGMGDPYSDGAEQYTYAVSSPHSKQIGKYIYAASPPVYLSYSDFLGVSELHIVKYDKNGNAVSTNGLNISVYIWPQIIGGNEYGVFFTEESQGLFKQIYIDENINFLPYDSNDKEYNEEAEKLIKDNYDEIKEKMDKAKELWGLNGLGDVWVGMRVFIGNMSATKILIILAILGGIAFVVINISWLFSSLFPFERYKSELGRVGNDRKALYQKEIDGFLCTAHKPSYLRNNGFLSIGKTFDNSVDGQIRISLNIYPRAAEKQKSAVFFNSEEKTAALSGSVKHINERTEKAVYNKEQYAEEIKLLIAEAKAFWGCDVSRPV